MQITRNKVIASSVAGILGIAAGVAFIPKLFTERNRYQALSLATDYQGAISFGKASTAENAIQTALEECKTKRNGGCRTVETSTANEPACLHAMAFRTAAEKLHVYFQVTPTTTSPDFATQCVSDQNDGFNASNLNDEFANFNELKNAVEDLKGVVEQCKTTQITYECNTP